MVTKYIKEYFIKKFEAIPNKEIGKGNISNHCALWHCGTRWKNRKIVITKEAQALILLFGGKDEMDAHYVAAVNDGWNPSESKLTPKERILNKLKSL